jgi:hypothetical protein
MVIGCASDLFVSVFAFAYLVQISFGHVRNLDLDVFFPTSGHEYLPLALLTNCDLKASMGCNSLFLSTG